MQAVSRPLPPRARPMAMTGRTDSKLGVHVGGPTPPMSCSQVKSTQCLTLPHSTSVTAHHEQTIACIFQSHMRACISMSEQLANDDCAYT